ncbi:dethiobiotin synthase [Chromatium okenii]|uniref:ATP-dependent dethiobiotin synthetase BioD n=1 Tax=Chromatium okenii TaxID=61644 RepID=A0A2S7XSF6_9GAMM|nr:dethiobiotin synthase [Chromatium okenii]PQJ96655.1 dethiobiotin synthase [Chromatium okenii]
MSGIFITGTDTDCGKTTISLGLMAAMQQRGLRVNGMKPVASGCAMTPAGLRNADARQLLAQSSHRNAYALVNPYAFAPPIAPHLAAIQAGVTIDFVNIIKAYQTLAATAEVVIVEGVGGWRVPLMPNQCVSDLALALEIPVILVVGFKLGCLNHALLTAESIRASGAHLIGWICNQIDPKMQALNANLATLNELIAAPCLGVVPWNTAVNAQQIATQLKVELLTRSIVMEPASTGIITCG